jgi:hypothetical protein
LILQIRRPMASQNRTAKIINNTKPCRSIITFDYSGEKREWEEGKGARG